MSKKRLNSPVPAGKLKGYDAILRDVVQVLEHARHAAARTVNAVMTAAYWQIGKHIVEHEQHGIERADYGTKLLTRLAHDLTDQFGRGFSRQNLQSMRAFYLAYPTAEICQTSSGKSLEPPKRQTPSGKSARSMRASPTRPSAIKQASPAIFPLPWSHYVSLLSVKNELARRFYETEAIRGGWTVKQLDRQIDSLFYERAALSRNKVAMLTKGARNKPEDRSPPEEQIKDPFVLEFLGLKDEYSESAIEEALIRHLESFLLELGGDFTFVGRQRRLRIGDQWFRVDLLFFHRKLRCLVIIDLKIGRFTHADAGQMHLYCNYAAEHWTHAGENPPVGLILCAQKDAAVAHYALENLHSKILAAEYRLNLPDEKTIVAELKRTQKLLDTKRKIR